MAMYNQVFDMYHCIYRIIHILDFQRFDTTI